MLTILISVTLLFISTFIDFITLRKIVFDKKRTNILTFVSCVGALTVTGLIGFYSSADPFKSTVLLIISDYRFWISLVLEFAALMLLRINFSINNGNMTAVKMGIFSSVFFVPIVSFFLTDPLGFSNTITISYSSPVELVVLTAVSLIAYGMFFAKGKCTLAHPLVLILMTIVLPFAVFMAVKNMQLFNAYIFFAMISFSNVILYLLLAIYKREDFSTLLSHKKDYAFVFSTTMIVFSLFPYIASIISAEFFTILKRIFSILIAMIFDAKDKCVKISRLLSKTKILALLMLFGVGIYFQVLIN